jgi:hypothetical protein
MTTLLTELPESDFTIIPSSIELLKLFITPDVTYPAIVRHKPSGVILPYLFAADFVCISPDRTTQVRLIRKPHLIGYIGTYIPKRHNRVEASLTHSTLEELKKTTTVPFLKIFEVYSDGDLKPYTEPTPQPPKD